MAAARRFAVFSALAVVACGRIGYELEASEQPAGSGGHGGQAAPDAAIADSAIADAAADDGAASSDAANVPVACNGDVPGVADECTELPRLPTAPTIDGLPDCALPVYSLTPVGWSVDGGPPDAIAAYAVAWRPNGLYFYVRVTDPTPIVADASEPAADGDGVELFVDSDGSYSASPNYDNPGTRRFVVAAPPDAVTPSARGEVWSGATQVEAVLDVHAVSRVPAILRLRRGSLRDPGGSRPLRRHARGRQRRGVGPGDQRFLCVSERDGRERPSPRSVFPARLDLAGHERDGFLSRDARRAVTRCVSRGAGGKIAP